MARQIIDLGTSPNRGDGDPLRTAFDKVNDNFSELYAGQNSDPSNTAASLIPESNSAYDLGSFDNQWADIHIADFIYLNGARIEVTAGGTLLVKGVQPTITYARDIVGSVFADDSTLLVDGVNSQIPSSVVAGTEATNWDTAYSWGDHSVAGYLTSFTETDPVVGAITGIVKADGAGNISAAVAGTDYLVAETINLATLKTEVAASIDFEDFQTRIAAL